MDETVKGGVESSARNHWLVRFLQAFSPTAIAAVIAVSIAVFVGWALDITFLKRVSPGLPAMVPNTALGLLLSGLSLHLVRDPAHRARAKSRYYATALALFVLALGAATLSEYLFGWEFGIDRLLFARQLNADGALYPGRPAPHSALALVFGAIALLTLNAEAKPGYRIAEIPALVSGAIPLLALIGYATDTAILYGIPSGPGIALHTVLVFLLFACALLFDRRDPDFPKLLTGATAGSILTRRLLVTALIITVALGGFRLLGEAAGLYDKELATSMLVLALFGALMWATSSYLTQSDLARQRVEEALRESEDIYRAVVDNVADGILISVGTTRKFANKGFLRIHGVKDLADVIEQPCDQFVVPEEKSMLRERTLARQRGENVPSIYEYRIRRADGEIRTLQAAAVRITYRGQPATLAAIRDITERGRAEEALRASEERFRAVVETANQAIISADSDGNITQFNRAAERIFGYAAEGVMGKPLTILMPERFRAAHEQGLNRFRSTGESRVIGGTTEVIGRRQDGTEFPLELSLTAWKIGPRYYFTGILVDIAERKRREEEIRMLNERLNRRAIELEAVNRELEAFSYSASHDLRAPLRSINGFSQALLEDCADKLDEQGKRYLQRICAATERMGQIIDDMLMMARVTRSELRVEIVDMSALARRIAEELQRSAPQRQVEWVIASGLEAHADPGLLRAALENLLGNAWKFTSKKEKAKIEFGVTENPDSRVFFVRDNGAGFDMAYADKLFGVFQRLHSAGEFEGTGIGLATVQRIVHRHGGRIWAEGVVGQGASFYFTLSDDQGS
ncbi:MAG TPA: PAS domain S-box protein [Candidatus Acidoferrales bacterium]|nr:PAS domain S-box protein [Candidatus Acidoferrales bacterium]